MVAKDALYAEAEDVARQLYAEFEKMHRAGGSDRLPPELESITAGTARDSALKRVREVKAFGERSTGGSMSLLWLRRNVGASKEGSDISLVSCFDARSTVTKVPGQPDRPGQVVSDALFFTRVDGVLKVWADETASASGCP